MGLPAASLAPGALGPAGFLPLLAYPAQVVRLAVREGAGRRGSWEFAAFTVLGKEPEALGAPDLHLGRLHNRRTRLIQCK